MTGEGRSPKEQREADAAVVVALVELWEAGWSVSAIDAATGMQRPLVVLRLAQGGVEPFFGQVVDRARVSLTDVDLRLLTGVPDAVWTPASLNHLGTQRFWALGIVDRLVARTGETLGGWLHDTAVEGVTAWDILAAGDWDHQSGSLVFAAAAKIPHPTTPLPEPAGDPLEGLRLGEPVDRLNPETGGRWLVNTEGTRHIFDLDAGSYTRWPGRGTMSTFDFDRTELPLTRFHRQPVVGGRFELDFDAWPPGCRDAADGVASTPVVSIRPILEPDDVADTNPVEVGGE